MNRRVFLVGHGCTPVGELWDKSLYSLATSALERAAGQNLGRCTALVVGNMLSGVLCGQENLAAVLASRLGMRGVECLKVEAACASGAAAVRVAESIIRVGDHDSVAVLGVEKMTDTSAPFTAGALAQAVDVEREGILGVTNVSTAALATDLYLCANGLTPEDLAAFPLNAHRHAAHNPAAMFRSPITRAAWESSPTVADPLRRLDCAPICDGAAALILSCKRPVSGPTVELIGSAGVADHASFADRPEPLRFAGAEASARAAFERAEVERAEVTFVEPHDAFPVAAALGLEALGLAEPGCGWRFLDGPPGHRASLQNGGGLKGRGHPVGATGVYQVVDAVHAVLRRRAAEPSAPPAVAVTQSFGGLAANALTLIFREVIE